MTLAETHPALMALGWGTAGWSELPVTLAQMTISSALPGVGGGGSGAYTAPAGKDRQGARTPEARLGLVLAWGAAPPFCRGLCFPGWPRSHLSILSSSWSHSPG